MIYLTIRISTPDIRRGICLFSCLPVSWNPPISVPSGQTKKMPARISPSDRKNHRTSLNQLRNPVCQGWNNLCQPVSCRFAPARVPAVDNHQPAASPVMFGIHPHTKRYPGSRDGLRRIPAGTGTKKHAQDIHRWNAQPVWSNCDRMRPALLRYKAPVARNRP